MWWIIPIALALFILIIIVRALLFTPKVIQNEQFEEITFDKEKATANLVELIKCKTVSYKNSELEDEREFQKFISLLPKLYKNVYKVCEITEFDDRGLLFLWKGVEKGDPAVFMSHYDVVPVNEDSWDKPPFDAVIEDGKLYGRGALDTKVTFNAILSAADHLITSGYIPKNDVYFAFSGGEEVNGNGAKHIVEYFYKNNLTPSIVLDEGGAVVEDVFPGVKSACGLIGIAEKGMIDLCYKSVSNGGHASAPKPKTPVDSLAAACCKLIKKPFKAHITEPVKQMFDTLGRHSTFVYRMIFANIWLFKPILNIICKKSGGELNALLRTTVAFTQMSGSSASNVIPPEATMVSNIRLNPQDSVNSAKEYIKKTIKDNSIELSILHSTEPSRISRTDCDGYEKLTHSIKATWKGAIVSPYLMMQCSDSRHWGMVSDKVYRFSAMDLTKEERSTIHGNNEHIRLETLYRSVEFYIRLMEQM